MIRIICSECKNAYLQNKGDKYVCSSCGAEMSREVEALVLGIQNYNEGNFSEAADHLMKYIVKNGAEPRAIFYKALCDAFQTIDGDTDSISETYEKLLECFKDFSEKDFPEYIALANDEGRKLEKALAEQHVLTLVSADAEKIKAEVAAILSIQKEARDFRISLKDVVNEYNETAAAKLSVRFSECYLLGKDIAQKVGDLTYDKIVEDISNHTVFTGILSNNIKNLEIYLRCIVMFFKKSHDKYEFLKDEAQKFINIAELLQKGQYNTLTGVDSISEKLMKESYDFLYESYNEHYDEKIEMQTECVVVLEPEEAAEETSEQAEEQTPATEEVVEEIPEEAECSEEIAEENDATEEAEAAAEESDEAEAEIEETEEASGITETDDFVLVVDDEAEEIEEETAEVSEEAPAEEPEEAPVEEAVEPAEAEDEPAVITLADVKAKKEAQEDAPAEDTPAEETEAKASEDTSFLPERKSKKKKSGKGKVLVALIVVLVIAVVGIKYIPEAITEHKYEQATTLVNDGKYLEAIEIFKQIPEYSDSEEQIKECSYKNAEKLEADGKHSEARLAYEALGEYKDCLVRVQTCIYGEATAEFEAGNFDKAAKLFNEIKDYGNSSEMINECTYKKAVALLEGEDYEDAIELFKSIKSHADSAEKVKEAKYLYVTNNLDKKNKTTVKYLDQLTKAKYRNSAELRKELLGSETVTNGDIKSFVNYDKNDLTTALTELDHNKAIYFHVVVKDSSLYGKPLTLKYTTQYGYSQSQRVTITKNSNTAAMYYPSTNLGNYKVTFDLLGSDGTKLATQTITF